MTPTPADPGAIDLEEFKRFLHTLDKEAHLSPHAGTAHGHISNLIAAVEALRLDTSAESKLGNLFDYGIQNPVPHDSTARRTERAEFAVNAIKAERIRTVAAEARVAELEEAISAWLEHRHDVFCAQMQGTFDKMPTNRIDEIVQQCEDILAATPAEALERARGFEQLARDAVSDLRRYARDDGPERRMVSVRLYEKAFAKLDTLGKEGP